MRAINKPDELVQAAAELKMSAIGITDYNTLSGIDIAYKAAKKTKLIVGCELNFTDDRQSIIDFNNGTIKDKPIVNLRKIVLIAKNGIGYKNLLNINFEAEKCKLDRLSKVDKKATIDWKVLETYKEGLICLSGGSTGIVNKHISDCEHALAEQEAIKFHNMFGDDFVLELQPNNIINEGFDQIAVNQGLYRLSKKLNIHCVAACGALYTNPEKSITNHLVSCIKNHRPFRTRFAQRYIPNQYLHNGDEIVKFFARNYGKEFAEQLCNNSIELANKCEEPKWVNPLYITGKTHLLPTFPVKKAREYDNFIKWQENNEAIKDVQYEDQKYMRYLCEKRFHILPQDNIEVYKDRYKEELEVFEKKGFSSYMLITSDFLNWSRDNGVRIGPGRGCADKNTLILTTNGYKKITDVNIGEKVFTHTGNIKTVTNKFEFDVDKDEDCLEIQTEYSFGNSIFTKNHKLFGCKHKITDLYYNKVIKEGKISYSKRKKYENPNLIEEIECQNLEVNDWLYMPFVKRENIIENYLLDFNIRIGKHTSTIKIDDDFYYFLGRWVGDGWICYPVENRNIYTIGLAFNSNDKKSINWFVEYFKKYKLNPCVKKEKKKNEIIITIYNKSFVEKMIELFPNYRKKANTKSYPDFFRNLTENQLRLILKGHLDSDGHVSRNHKCITSNRCCIDTVSLTLAFNVRELLLYLGVPSSIVVRKPFKRGKYNCQQSYKIKFNKLKLEQQIPSGFYTKITSIKNKKLDKVYDITVEDHHSYLTQNYASHNSCGGSLVAHLLNIHQADPIKYGLIFPRFINIDRVELPDLDLDIASTGRDKLLNYVASVYGESNVAHVSNFVCFTPKNALTDVVTALEFGGSRAEAFKIAKNITDTMSEKTTTIEGAAEDSPFLQEFLEQNPQIKEYVNGIIGLPRSYSTHAAGVIVSSDPLLGLVPLRIDEYGNVCLEYEKVRAEANGLVKIDFLGLETLNIIDVTNEIINELKLPPAQDPPDYSVYDEKVYNLISSGDTFGVFQFGTSGGTIDLCKKIEPHSLEDLAAITALARPGVPQEVKKSYIERRFGREEIEIPHPNFEKAVKATMGLPIFEECFLFLAHHFCGWNLQRSDKMRKISKLKAKGKHLLIELEEGFIKGAIECSNVDEEFAKNIWDEWVIPLSGYAFNKSHSILYSMTSLHTAYLKAYYFAPFMVASLISKGKNNSPKAKGEINKFRQELRTKGVNIYPPNVNISSSNYKLASTTKLLTGFAALKGVKENAAQEIVNKRPFKDFGDFLLRLDTKLVHSPVIDALAAVGALDSFGISRKSMIIYGSDLRKKIIAYNNRNTGTPFEYELPKEEWTNGELRALEMNYLGESFAGTKRDSYPSLFTNKGVKAIKDIANLPDKEPAVVELEIKNIFTFRVKNKESKIFNEECCRIVGEDIGCNQIALVMFPQAFMQFKEQYYREFGEKAKIDKGFGIRANTSVNRFQGEVSLVVNEVYMIAKPVGMPTDKEKKTVKIYSKVSRKKMIKKTAEDVTDDILSILGK